MKLEVSYHTTHDDTEAYFEDLEREAIQAETLEEVVLLGLSVETFNTYQLYRQGQGMKPLLCQCNLTDYCFTQEDDAEFIPDLEKCGVCRRQIPWCYLENLGGDRCCNCGRGGLN